MLFSASWPASILTLFNSALYDLVLEGKGEVEVVRWVQADVYASCVQISGRLNRRLTVVDTWYMDCHCITATLTTIAAAKGV